MAKPLFNIGDSDLISIARNTASVVAANPSAYEATADDAAELSAFVDLFDADLETQKAAKAAAKSATEKKKKSREAKRTAFFLPWTPQRPLSLSMAPSRPARRLIICSAGERETARSAPGARRCPLRSPARGVYTIDSQLCSTYVLCTQICGVQK